MLLNRLIKLYRSSSQNTPLENFTTEALVGVLEEDTTLLDDFVNKVLKIHGRGFKIESQKRYICQNENRYIDVLVYNHETLCFIENKVDSPVNQEQLRIYSEILKAKVEESSLKPFLKLCTRFTEDNQENLFKDKPDFFFKSKYIDEETFFLTFRWNDIYQFLKNYETNLLVKDFRQFLKSNGMGLETNLSIDDIKVFNDFQKIMPKFDEYRNLYTNSFKKHISKKYVSQDQFRRLLRNNDMVIFTENILGENAWSGIGTGLKIEDKTYFFVWIWLNDGNSKLSYLLKELEIIKPTIEGLEIHKNGLTIRKPLEEFVSENPNEKIKNWFDENLGLVRELIEKTSELDWKIK